MPTQSAWKFCPFCASSLAEREVGDGHCCRLACTTCQFVHWDSPVPVVATLIPMDGGVVLVQRAVEPFKGRWCLPRGFMNRGEIPKRAAVRETREETGLKVWLVRIINACNPSPAGIELNQVTMFYLARKLEGELAPGSDALAVGVFTADNLPDICFRSDRILVDDWFAGRLGALDN